MAQMDKATMKGFWRLIKETQLSPAKEETYNIRSARKSKQHLAYQQPHAIRKDRRDNADPCDRSLGRRHARHFHHRATHSRRWHLHREVLIYENTYAGTWSGPGYGGLLSGVIVKERPSSLTA